MKLFIDERYVGTQKMLKMIVIFELLLHFCDSLFTCIYRSVYLCFILLIRPFNLGVRVMFFPRARKCFFRTKQKSEYSICFVLFCFFFIIVCFPLKTDINLFILAFLYQSDHLTVLQVGRAMFVLRARKCFTHETRITLFIHFYIVVCSPLKTYIDLSISALFY